jgi:hypothetical protein
MPSQPGRGEKLKSSFSPQPGRVRPASVWAPHPQTPSRSISLPHSFHPSVSLPRSRAVPPPTPAATAAHASRPPPTPPDRRLRLQTAAYASRPPPTLHRPPPTSGPRTTSTACVRERTGGLATAAPLNAGGPAAAAPLNAGGGSSRRRQRRSSRRTRLLFSFLFEDSMAFLFYFQGPDCFYIFRAGLNPYDLPNRISAELGSAHTSYQTQHKNLICMRPT